MRQLVTVRTISDIQPIENADSIECVTIDGWEVVSKKGEFAVNGLCVYFEIDSFLPADDKRFEFLVRGGTRKDPEGKARIRLKTIKLRGQVSQGLALPLSQFPEITDPQLDTDYSELLGVIKYEIPEKTISGNPAGNWPHFLQKTDEDRVQNVFGKLKNKYPPDTLFVPTLKLDGSSCTVAACNESIPGYERVEPKEDGIASHVEIQGYDVIVCSRNLQLKVDTNSHFWNSVIMGGIEMAAVKISQWINTPVAIQGEVMGPGIQGNKEKFDHHMFFAFNVYDILKRTYLPFQFAQSLLEDAGIRTVPILGGPLAVFKEFESVKDVVAAADGPSINAKYREGVVFKSVGVEPPISFKAISNRFLLKAEE